MNDIRVAIVGAGYMAQEHARAFASLPGVRISGVCGRSPERARALASQYGVSAYADAAELYKKTGADVVVVAVDELSMLPVCQAVFAYPWICLLEKPVGIDLRQALTIQASAAAAGARAFVAFNRRSYGATRQAVRELTVDDSPRLISVLDQQDMSRAREIGEPEVVVANYMFANSIHLVDYLIQFGRGDVVEVQRIAAWNPLDPRHVVASVRFSTGDLGIYQAVWNGPGPWAVSVTNALVRVELRPLERLGVQRRGERVLTEAPPDSRDCAFKPGLVWQAEQLVAAAAGKPCDLATLSDSTRAMRLCASIYGLDAT